MNIRESEDRLFAEWRHHRPNFVADGVVDQDAYLRSAPKLLFVLKEVIDPHGGGWDLREFVGEGGRPKTWNNVARWVEGIRRLSEDIPWHEIADIDETRRRQTLKSVAVLNLKKSPGGHTTDPREVSAIAAEDSDFLNRQWSLYAPDLIICCGTSGQVHRLIDACAAPTWRATRRGIPYHELRAGQFVLDYLHPEARCAPPLLFYGLIDALREILSVRIRYE